MVDNALVYQILSKIFTDMDAYVYVKIWQCTSTSTSDFCALTMWPGRLQMQTSHYDGENRAWDWDKFITLHKEQHAIKVRLTDYGYSGMDNALKSTTFSRHQEH